MIKGYHYKICRHQKENKGRLQKTLVVQKVKRLPAMQETWIQSLDQEDPLEKEMATPSSTLAWEIPWTEEPGRATYSPWGHRESDTTEQLHFVSLSH